MDISKLWIPTLDGPNWGQWLDRIQSTARILDIWDAMRGEILTPAPNLTRDWLVKPSQPAANATTAEIAAYTTTKAVWSKKNAQGLALIQATVSNVIWQKHESLGTAKEVLDALETEFRAVVGGHRPTSNWSTWWNYSSLIRWIYCHRSKVSRIIITWSHWMATADSLKTWWPSCSAWVFQTHMNRLPGNTLIISRVLPITKYQISLHKSYKKRIGEKPMLSDKACPSTSSQQTLGRSVPSVEKQTTLHRITGLGERIQIKKAKDNQGPKSQIRLEKRRWTKRGRAKKGTSECQCIICTGNGQLVYTNGTINWFFMLQDEWKSGMVLG